MNKHFNTVRSGRTTHGVLALWGLLLATVMAALLGGPVGTAAAVTTTPEVSVIPDASGASSLLTVTRLAGNENRFTFTTPKLRVKPLPSSSAAQFVQVDWELQSATPSTTMAWTKVQYSNSSTGLYTVTQDPDDPEGLGYVYVPLAAGKDLGAAQFTSRVVTAKAQAFRVVAKVTWTDRATGARLGSVTLTPTTAADLSCKGTTRAHCWVNDIYPNPREPYVVLR